MRVQAFMHVCCMVVCMQVHVHCVHICQCMVAGVLSVRVPLCVCVCVCGFAHGFGDVGEHMIYTVVCVCFKYMTIIETDR